MSEKKINVFDYQSIQQLLHDLLSHLSQAHPNEDSTQLLTDKLGLQNKETVQHWLQGTLALEVSDIELLAKYMHLNSVETFYLKAMVAFQKNEAFEDAVADFSNETSLVHENSKKEYLKAEISDFEVISHWKYTVILASTNLTGLHATEENIVKLLSKYFGSYEVKQAINRLVSIGLLLNQSGVLVATHKKVSSKDEHCNLGTKLYHKSTCQLAADKIDSTPLDQREMQSYTLNISKNKVELAKKLIKEFRQNFIDEVSFGDDVDEVYQLNMHFFPLIAQEDLLLLKKERGDEEAVC